MTQADDEPWFESIAKVTFDEDDSNGTAFFIGGRHFVTALHVVVDQTKAPLQFKSAIKLTLYGLQGDALKAEVVPEFWSEPGDWVVLESERSPGVPAIEFAAHAAHMDVWRTFGFPKYENLAIGTAFRGTVEYSGAQLGRGDDRVAALQLNCKQASAGDGAPLDGLSGAPCLVQGRAVGVLINTPFKTSVDSRRIEQKQTLAGTVYAVRAKALLDWQVAHRRAVLEGSWLPDDILAPDLTRDLEGQDFLVLLSSQEPVDEDGSRVRLRDIADTAYKRLRRTGLTAPYHIVAADALSSRETLRAVVRALCRSKVVVFDASGFEPVVMFLAGIRAVCRRGVTLLSVGGERRLGDDLEVPFNLKDANLIVHSKAQDRVAGADSAALMFERIRRGLKVAGTSQYQDLPVYEAIRLLPPEERGLIPREEGVLVLCPFDAYREPPWLDLLHPELKASVQKARDDLLATGRLPPNSDFEQTWQGLQLGLETAIQAARDEAVADGRLPPNTLASIGVARSFELRSPRLVTQAVYAHIRKMELCVIDLSRWKPNVLFELGVRLAATSLRSICVLEADWVNHVPANLVPQCHRLIELLVGSDYFYRRGTLRSQHEFFDRVFGQLVDLPDLSGCEIRPLPHGVLGNHLVHNTLQSAIDVKLEPAAQAIADELMARAELFARETVGSTNSPAGLFPQSAAMNEQEQQADFEHLVATCLYLGYRQRTGQLRGDIERCRTLKRALDKLDARHNAGSKESGLSTGMADFMSATPGLRRRIDHLRRIVDSIDLKGGHV